MSLLYGAIEAGGTKIICAVGNQEGEIIERVKFPTETPDITMPKIVEFFKDKEVKSIGLGCFGPCDLDEKSDTFGYITSTPKTVWQYFNIMGYLKEKLHIPVIMDTDVNGAAYGEYKFGAAKDTDNFIYITIGTGFGVGAMVNGKLLHGMTHPEMGHIIVKPHEDDNYQGRCPYHGNCLEGMAAGPAIEERWGKPGFELQDKKEVWELEAYYIAQALRNFILVLSPKKIIIGGGVMGQKQIFDLVRVKAKELLNGYVQHKNILEEIDQYIVSPGLGDNAGIVGALALNFM